jgi:hypothetical protein
MGNNENDTDEAKAGRLRMARELDGRYERAAGAARALKMPIPTYQAHENSSRGFPTKVAQLYASFYSVSLEWLLTGVGSPTGKGGKKAAPIIGLLGAGSEITLTGIAKQQSAEQPSGHTDCLAVRVSGDSQFPLRNGWLVFWRKDSNSRVPENCIGQLCVAKIKGGPLVMKEVRHGHSGNFNLLSFNGPIRENVELEWAAKIVEIRPK